MVENTRQAPKFNGLANFFNRLLKQFGRDFAMPRQIRVAYPGACITFSLTEMGARLFSWMLSIDPFHGSTPLGRRGPGVAGALRRGWCFGGEDFIQASPLRQETTMTLAWTANRLRMGSCTCVSNLLREKQMIFVASSRASFIPSPPCGAIPNIAPFRQNFSSSVSSICFCEKV